MCFCRTMVRDTRHTWRGRVKNSGASFLAQVVSAFDTAKADYHYLRVITFCRLLLAVSYQRLVCAEAGAPRHKTFCRTQLLLHFFEISCFLPTIDPPNIAWFDAGAAAENVFVCPDTCTSEATCQAAAFGCKQASSRRFKFLFGSFSPAGYYFRYVCVY